MNYEQLNPGMTMIPETVIMDGERYANQYPILIRDWFDKDNLSRFNFRAVQKILDGIAPGRVLDWGCGNLMWSLGLFPNAEIVGVETTKEKLSWARTNADFNGVTFSPLLYSESIDQDLHGEFDLAVSFGLIEFLEPEMFDTIHTLIQNALKPDGQLFCVFHNWRPFSALFLPSLRHGGYKWHCKRTGYTISKKSLHNVCCDLEDLGFHIKQSGAFNPYPGRLSPFISSDLGYITNNKSLSYWYCSQFILAQKAGPYTHKLSG